MKAYHINIDFEAWLFDSHYSLEKFQKFNKEYEYLFLWLEDDQVILSSSWIPEESFLSYIKNLTGSLPKIQKVSESIPWWGNTLNFKDEEKKWNSKIFSTKLAIEKGLCHRETQIIETEEQLNKAIGESQYSKIWLRDPHQFSGRGSIRIQKGEEKQVKKVIERLEQGPLVFDPELKRVRDFGTTFLNGENSFIIQNLNDKSGHFKGAIWQKNFTEAQEIRDRLQPIHEEFSHSSLDYPLQVDSFYYIEEGELKLYPLVEINHRKTMGLMTQFFSRFVNEDEVGMWMLVPNSFVKPYKTFNEKLERLGKFNYNPELKRGAIATNEKDNIFETFFICEKNLKELQFLVKNVWKCFVGEERSLPFEFIVYF